MLPAVVFKLAAEYARRPGKPGPSVPLPRADAMGWCCAGMLAEAGASANEMMAVTGRQTVSEVTR